MEFASIQAVALERADNKEAELQRVKRDNERLAAALEWKHAVLQRARRDRVQQGARLVRQPAILGRLT